MRRLLPLLILLTPLLAVRPAGADEDDADVRAYRRAQLLRIAAQSVDPTNPKVGGLEDIRALTQKQRAKFLTDADAADARDHLDQIDQLVGTTEEAPRGASEGVIPQAARLHRWVHGILLPDERHDLERVNAWRAKEVEEELKEAKAAFEAQKEQAAEGEEKPTAFDAGAAEKRIREAVHARIGPADAGFDVHKPGFYILGEDGKPVLLAPTPPKDITKLTEAERAALVRGSIRIRTQRPPNSGDSVVGLAGIQQLWDAIGLLPDQAQPRFTLVHPQELAWIDSQDYVGWRELQVAVRREALAEQTVTSIISDADVEVRRERKEAYATQKRELEERIRLVEAAFDSLWLAHKHWTREVSRKSVEIEEQASKCEDCTPDEKVEEEKRLERMRLAERAFQQELRLLYITALRAKARLDHMQTALGLASEELVLAEDSYQRYVDAQSRTRRENQLFELRSQADELRGRLDRATKRSASEGLAPEDRSALEIEIAATERMLELNGRLTALVRLRRTLEARAAGKSDVEAGRASTEPPAAESAAPPTDGDKAAATETPVDPLATARDPASRDLNANYLVLVREKLDHPDFEAKLVAEHHAAASDVVETLDSALAEVRAADLSLQRFDTIGGQVLGGFPKDQPPDWYWDFQPMLVTMRRAYADSADAIREKQTQIEERVDLLRGWMGELEGLGVRSFAIRQNRTLGAEQLKAAGQELSDTAKHTVRWFGFDGDEHLGTFVSRYWVPLLFLAGMLLVSFFVVRLGRRWIDERLTRMALRAPELRTGPITVGAEAEEAKQHRQAVEAARREAEEAALKDAAGEGEGRKGPVRGSSGEAGEGA